MIEQELCRIVVTGFFLGFLPIFLIFFKILEAIQDNNNYKKQILLNQIRLESIARNKERMAKGVFTLAKVFFKSTSKIFQNK